jgi:hypothetical protein
MFTDRLPAKISYVHKSVITASRLPKMVMATVIRFGKKLVVVPNNVL